MRLKIMGLCLVAVFAMAAVVSSSASAAAPAFFECHKQTTKPYTGKFTDKACSKAATAEEIAAGKKNKYELQEGTGAKGKPFKGKGPAATLHTPAVGGEVTCKSFKDEGTINTPTTENKVTSEFKTCESLKKKCASAGQKAGTIKTSLLAGELGYISKSPLKVGVLLKPETGTVLAAFNCEGLEIETTGSVIGEQKGDINVFSKKSENVFTINGEGFQSVKNFEGGSNHELLSKINGSGPFPSGQQATAVNTGEELEIKA
jgi:hypothetical protein